ncbi:MAG: sulfatase, partial [Verrucomicrobiaceae bacterium]
MMLRFLLLCCLGLTGLSPAMAAPPNVVMIISDDQGFGDYGFMGHPLAATPHLDKLAARSLCFKNGYVPSSLCCPSLASLITGRYPHQHGITGNDPSVDRTAGAWTRTPEFVA